MKLINLNYNVFTRGVMFLTSSEIVEKKIVSKGVKQIVGVDLTVEKVFRITPRIVINFDKTIKCLDTEWCSKNREVVELLEKIIKECPYPIEGLRINLALLNVNGKEVKILPKIEEVKPIVVNNVKYFILYAFKEPEYYLLTSSEVKIPLNVFGIAFRRSTFMRSGLIVINTIFDPFYQGEPVTLIQVPPYTVVILYQGCGITQLICAKVEKIEKGYSGTYQGEKY